MWTFSSRNLNVSTLSTRRRTQQVANEGGPAGGSISVSFRAEGQRSGRMRLTWLREMKVEICDELNGWCSHAADRCNVPPRGFYCRSQRAGMRRYFSDECGRLARPDDGSAATVPNGGGGAALSAGRGSKSGEMMASRSYFNRPMLWVTRGRRREIFCRGAAASSEICGRGKS